MLDPVPKWHHAVVAVAVLATPVLVAFGFAGQGRYPERFDAKQVLVVPDGADGVRIREVVDEDFGSEDRHGYERTIPNDFGAPTDVQASSPDAPDDLTVDDFGSETRIRIGDPNTTISGQHRYELSYTLPAAQISTGRLALDIISPGEELETGRFEVVLAGFDLQDPTCNAGPFGAVGGCTLERDGDVYRAVIEPLAVGAGITVGGTIVGLTMPADVPVPPIPERRSSHPLPLAAGTLALGALAGVGGFLLTRRMGRNEVGGASPADAAYAVPNDGPVRMVTDSELDAMATTEFEPPRGLRPWHGTLLLTERISTATVSAWFSDQISQQVIELRNDGKQLVAGPHLAESPPITRSRIETLLGDAGEITLGTYEPRLTALWKQVMEEQKVAARESGWWKRGAPGSPAAIPQVLVSVMLLLFVILGIAFWSGLRQSVPITIAAAFVGPAVVAGWAYWSLLPSRSASGSAAALRAESFRRFLEASEGKHVDWAWQHGLLREYSAWAVALGAAAAWGKAIAASAVPPPEVASNTMPLLMYSMASDFHSTITPPQSSSSSGFSGGGFSGGFSGGGGGGGSSGSW